MERNMEYIDVNALPVHLFVKSPKQAKKVERQFITISTEPMTFKKSRRFKLPFAN